MARNKILIAIQARSTSKRFPRKSFAMLGGKTLLQHVVHSCTNASGYCNQRYAKFGVMSEVAILCPEGDEIVQAFSGEVLIHEGPENDVLTRYAQAAKKYSADYIVRVTGDCPLIPSFLISKHILCSIQNSIDYLSNIDEQIRTAVDGYDCEVISKRCLEWLDTNAKEPYDREHVTPLIRKQPPSGFKIGHVIGHLDFSNLKLSVDTHEDLERVRQHYDKLEASKKSAERRNGPNSVFRF